MDVRIALRLFVVVFVVQGLAGCLSTEQPHIELGREYNGYDNRVMDTTSSFKLNDPFMLQLYNGQEFKADSVELVVYAGDLATKGPPLFRRMVRVKPGSRDLIVRGTQNDPLTARGFLRTSKTGAYVLEFRLRSNSIVQKELLLHSSKE